MKKTITIGLLLFAALLSSIQAATTTAASKSTATLASSCSISAQDISFGVFVPAKTGNVDATGSVTSTCSKGITYSIQMNGYSGYCNNRYMNSVSGNGNVLYFNVYTDAARSLIWTYSYWQGAGSSCLATSGGAYPTLTGTGAAQTNIVYARISANQFVPPGNYAGGVQVALYF
ncbi:Csu type fimbrial protein [Ralstonia pseudosolanacearum]